MTKELDVNALLRRGGEMSEDEKQQLARQMTEGKLAELVGGAQSRSLEQPVKVMNMDGYPHSKIEGCFTQLKFIIGATPVQMESMLGIFGKLSNGAYILQFVHPLKAEDYENRAYTYLPSGKVYVPNPNEKCYLPGDGVPQWALRRKVQAKCIAKLELKQMLTCDLFIR